MISKAKTAYLFIVLCAKVLSQEESSKQWTVSWNAPILSGTSGYGSEALSFLLGLNRTLSSSSTNTTTPPLHEWKIAAGLAHGDSIDWDYFNSLSPNLRDFLVEAGANQIRLSDPERTIVVCHSEPGAWSVPTPMYQSGSPCPPPLPPGSGSKKKWHAVIGRTMFETDRLPNGWQHRLNSVSEVWVPTEHHKRIFERDGVTKTPMVVVGQGVDTQTWNNSASRIKPLEWSVVDPDGHCKERDYKFLSVFKWEDRKGHDVLFQSFWNAFYNPLAEEDDGTSATAAGGACLVVVTSLYHENASRVWNDLRDHWIRATQKRERSIHPKFHPGVVLLSKMPTQDLVRLYKTMDAFVLPSRGEGWGRPYMEAMAMGLPVIATNWSGPTAFVTEENGYLLPATGLVDANLDAFPGHKWAEPDMNALKEIMVHLRDYPQDGKVKGNRGNQDVIEKWSHRAMADVVARELERLTLGVDHVDRSSSNEEL